MYAVEKLAFISPAGSKEGREKERVNPLSNNFSSFNWIKNNFVIMTEVSYFKQNLMAEWWFVISSGIVLPFSISIYIITSSFPKNNFLYPIESSLEVSHMFWEENKSKLYNFPSVLKGHTEIIRNARIAKFFIPYKSLSSISWIVQHMRWKSSSNIIFRLPPRNQRKLMRASWNSFVVFMKRLFYS